MAVTDREPAPSRVLLAAEDSAWCERIRGWLSREDNIALWVSHTPTRILSAARDEQPELAIIDLMIDNGAGVALAIELRRRAPHVEVAFYVEQPSTPEAQAARDFGLTRVLAASDLTGWLSRSLHPLAEVARYRRKLEAAQRKLEPFTVSEQTPARGTLLPLPVAERRFREAYLRACVAQTSGRREAARLAGIPYTSLCVMLRRLGIEVPR